MDRSQGLARTVLKTPLPAPRFRISCQKIIAHKMFDHVVLVFIFLNCITIALERPQIEAGSTVSGWGLQAVQGTSQRDRLPGPAVGQHAGLGAGGGRAL